MDTTSGATREISIPPRGTRLRKQRLWGAVHTAGLIFLGVYALPCRAGDRPERNRPRDATLLEARAYRGNSMDTLFPGDVECFACDPGRRQEIKATRAGSTGWRVVHPTEQ